MPQQAARAAAQHALSVNELASRLKALGVKPGRYAIALSGGPDSLALAALLGQLGPLEAFIVDHRLREESPREARQVQRMARALGMKAHILPWLGDKPTQGIMAAARRARYRLLIDACQRRGLTHLFIAHHQDDQIETVQMRRDEGSGARGLAGIPALAQLGAVQLVRPLLVYGKSRLVATCAALGLRPVDDPSNRNLRYTRVRVRHQCKDEQALLALQHKAAQARNQQLQLMQQAEGRVYRLRDGWAEVLAPEHLTGEMLRMLLQSVGQQEQPIRQSALDRALEQIRAHKAATLAGCLSHEGIIAREPQAIATLDLPAGVHHLWWDNRLALSFRLRAPALLAPLGRNTPWRTLPGRERLEALPGLVRASWPVLWRQGQARRLLPARWAPWYCPNLQLYQE